MWAGLAWPQCDLAPTSSWAAELSRENRRLASFLGPYPESPVDRFRQGQTTGGRTQNVEGGAFFRMSILWIILIVVLVLALLGFFSRGAW